MPGALKSIFAGRSQKRYSNLQQLKAAESKIGAEIFGQKRGVRTEFFNDTEKSWFFYQEIKGVKGPRQSVTFHYEVHPHGVLRIKNNDITGCYINGEELDNFSAATRIYYEKVMRQVYGKEPYADKSIARV